MFGQDSHESLDRTQNGSVNDHWSTETGLERHFMPRVLLGIVLIRRELLRSESWFHLFVFIGGISGLLFSGIFMLVLQIKSNRLLEIDLDSSALVLSLQSVIDLNVDLWPIECTITVIVGPGSAKFVQGFLKSRLCDIPLLLSAKTVLRSS